MLNLKRSEYSRSGVLVVCCLSRVPTLVQLSLVTPEIDAFIVADVCLMTSRQLTSGFDLCDLIGYVMSTWLWCIFPPNLVHISSSNPAAAAILDFPVKRIWHVPTCF